MSTNLIKVDATAVDASIDGIEQTLLGNARPAAQAGAEILYRAVLRNVNRKTGNLAEAIYQAFSEENSQEGTTGYQRATYHVSWNAKKAPHGQLVEFGHMQKFKAYIGKDGKWYTNKKAPLPTPVQVPARPFVRPAMSQSNEAAKAMTDRLMQGVT